MARAVSSLPASEHFRWGPLMPNTAQQEGRFSRFWHGFQKMLGLPSASNRIRTPATSAAEKASDVEEFPWYLTAGQILLAILGLVGAALHAFPIRIYPDDKENWPILDAVTIGWLALVIVSILLPNIGEITLGGASVKLREVKESADELVESLEDFANLVQNWSTSVAIYIDLLDKAESDRERELLLERYLRDRMGEAREFLSDDPDVDVRIAVWIFNPDTRRVEFLFSNELEPTQASYDPGEGMIGQAFLERRRFNESDVRSVPSYKRTRGGDPPYRAVLCVPVTFGDAIIGMLTADKNDATLFSVAADDIAKGLASQCALAIDQFRRSG